MDPVFNREPMEVVMDGDDVCLSATGGACGQRSSGRFIKDFVVSSTV